MRAIVSLILWYLPVGLVQLVSARVTITSIGPWYQSLKKGWGTPPAWVFGPTWTILYIMMAVAIWMIYREKKTKRQAFIAYFLFFVQLIFNGLWSFLFFQFHKTGWALADLTALVVFIFLTAIYFFSIKKLAGLLLVPYFLWSMYAFYLNLSIWRLN